MKSGSTDISVICNRRQESKQEYTAQSDGHKELYVNTAVRNMPSDNALLMGRSAMNAEKRITFRLFAKAQ